MYVIAQVSCPTVLHFLAERTEALLPGHITHLTHGPRSHSPGECLYIDTYLVIQQTNHNFALASTPGKTAIHSISTSVPFGRALTPTQVRAGGGVGIRRM
jgi:hypothetical protein